METPLKKPRQATDTSLGGINNTVDTEAGCDAESNTETKEKHEIPGDNDDEPEREEHSNDIGDSARKVAETSCTDAKPEVKVKKPPVILSLSCTMYFPVFH